MDQTDTTPTRIPDTESETPPQTQPIQPLSFNNGGGTAKKHQHQPAPAPSVYRECLKNHAANIGGHAVDGCGEFMPSPTYTPTDPTSLKCAACGCHRNFHRRENNDSPATAVTTQFLEFHRHPPPPRRTSSSPSPPQLTPLPNPAPPNYSYAPHMLLALSNAVVEEQQGVMAMNQQQHHYHHTVATPGTPMAVKNENPSGRKRFRTKFSQQQKEKMSEFAEKLGWKMQRCDEGMVEDFCHEVGIRRGILKVWMHNNKNTFGKKEKDTTTTAAAAAAATTTNITNGRGSYDNNVNGHNKINNEHENSHVANLQASTNGSSSSS